MTPGSPSAAGGSGASRDWATVLDELEGEVLAAESILRSDREDRDIEVAAWGRRAEDWVPPSSALGPVREGLLERAARLLEHRLAGAELLVERIIQSGVQRGLAGRMCYGPARRVPSYRVRAP